MSAFSRWSYTADITVWPVTRDIYGQETPGTPYTIKGSFQAGGNIQREPGGAEFIPEMTFYYEAASGETFPKVGDMILDGTHEGTPPSNAQKVRKVATWDETTFGADVPDRVAYT